MPGITTRISTEVIPQYMLFWRQVFFFYDQYQWLYVVTAFLLSYQYRRLHFLSQYRGSILISFFPSMHFHRCNRFFCSVLLKLRGVLNSLSTCYTLVDFCHAQFIPLRKGGDYGWQFDLWLIYG